jgi:NADH-quinone oxidoreductase subunit E
MKMDISKLVENETAEESMLEDIASELSSFERVQSSLIPILQLVQRKYAYLSEGAIRVVAKHLGVSTSEVFGVASFYNQFRFHPPGKHQIKVCLGTACHVVGADIILENFERKLGIREGETTPDREFSVERVACVGCCALAPVAIVDEAVQAHMAPSRVEGLLLGFEIEKEQQNRDNMKIESSE